MACDCCGGGKTPPIPDISQKIVIAALLWLAVVFAWSELISWIVFKVLSFSQEDSLAQFLQSFLNVAGNLTLLLLALTFLTVWLQTPVGLGTIRQHLNGRGTLWQLIIATYYGALMPRQAIDSHALFLGLGRVHKPRATATSYLAANLLFNKFIVAIVYSIAGYECAWGYLALAFCASLFSGFLIKTSSLSLPVRAVMMLKTKEPQPIPEPLPCLHERYESAKKQTQQTMKKCAIWILLGSVVFSLFLKGSLIGWITVTALGILVFRHWIKKDPLMLEQVINEQSSHLFYGYTATILTIIGLTAIWAS